MGLDPLLQEGEGAGQLDRAIEKAIVYRLDLNGNILSANGGSGSAKGSHASDHNTISPEFTNIFQQFNYKLFFDSCQRNF